MIRLHIVRLAYGMWERADIASWLVNLVIASQNWPDVEIVGESITNQLDVPSARNMASYEMERHGCNALLMVDYDMVPGVDFVRAAANHLEEFPASIIGAAYRSGWPERSPQARRQGRTPDELELVTNAEAATLRGIEEVAVVGTGLSMVGKAAFDLLPWSEGRRFEYAYQPEPPFAVVGTEDFVFCNKLRAKGGRVFVSWDHWCGHDKRELVGKPNAETQDIDGIAALQRVGWETVER